jgi:CRP-like cAMP-binding protein/CheY-like chemotaxis protein
MKRILIIEDNAELRENMAEIIALGDYEVLTAENGKLGVEAALAQAPHLIVCDIMMPVLDGYGVYHLLSKHAETASIPFIFLTAKSEKADIRKGMDMGADDYIMKPLDDIQLLHAIEVRLKKAEDLRRLYASPDGLTDFLQDAAKTGKVSLTSEERDVYSYNKKQSVYTEGQRPRAVYYVMSGKIKATRTNEDGKEFITAIMGAGEYFGYTAVLEDGVYTDGAQALEESQLMLIPREDFLQLLFNDLQIAGTFIKLISRNVVAKEEGLLHLAYSSVRRKVAHGLIQLIEKYSDAAKGHPVIKLSREHMAQSIGIATESLVRTLSDFKDEQLVAILPGQVVILNEKKLRQLPF